MSYRLAFYYGNRGELTCVLDPDNGLTYYQHDPLRRLTAVRNPWGESAYYAYDAASRLKQRTLGNGCVSYYWHDAAGQLTVLLPGTNAAAHSGWSR